MDIETVLGATRRYWFAVLAMLLVTVFAVAIVPKRIMAEYEAKGSVILLSPSTVEGSAGERVDVNPWSRFGSAEAGAAAAIVTILGTGAVEDQFIDNDKDVTLFSVGINQSNGAIIQLAVRASDPASALETYDKALALVDKELQERQEAAGAAESTWLRAEVLTRPSSAEEFPGSKTRAMLALAVLGMVASVALAVALDVVVTPRRKRGGKVDPPGRPSDSWDRLHDLQQTVRQGGEGRDAAELRMVNRNQGS